MKKNKLNKNIISQFLNKNKNLLFAFVSCFVMLISFLGYYYINDSFKIINELSGKNYQIKFINNNLKAITYLYIYTNVFSFLITIFHIKQFLISIKLREKAYKDELSTLLNRNFLEEELHNKLNPKNYFTIMCDIDHFKLVNDTYGHDIGDKVINFVGLTISNNIRNEDDYAIRYGGEEFLIIINKQVENYNKETIYQIFDRIHNIIKNKIFVVNNLEFQITLSFGINCYTKNVKTLNENIKMADIALYHAKKERNLIVMYTEENKAKFGMTFNEINILLTNDNLQLDLKEIQNINKETIAYYSNFYFLKKEERFNKDTFENIINLNEELIEKWLNKTLNYLKSYYIKEKDIFLPIKASWLLKQNIFDIIFKLYNNNIVLNIELDITNYDLFIKKLKKLKLYYKISLINNNKIFNIIESKNLIDFLFIEQENLNYCIFINNLSKNYDKIKIKLLKIIIYYFVIFKRDLI